jgi:hypothetical protein
MKNSSSLRNESRTLGAADNRDLAEPSIPPAMSEDSFLVLAFDSANEPLFWPSRFVVTDAAAGELLMSDITTALLAHITGDWGDVPPVDKAMNETLLKSGGRLLSSFRSSRGARYWVITDPGHDTTTVLLPSDY